jgi:hypothetical protein
VTRLGAARSRVLIPARARDCSLLHNFQAGSWAHPARCSFPGVKQQGREVNHSPPSSAEVKNEWSYTSTLPTCLHGVDRENFNFVTFNFRLYNVSCDSSVNLGTRLREGCPANRDSVLGSGKESFLSPLVHTCSEDYPVSCLMNSGGGVKQLGLLNTRLHPVPR